MLYAASGQGEGKVDLPLAARPPSPDRAFSPWADRQSGQYPVARATHTREYATSTPMSQCQKQFLTSLRFLLVSWHLSVTYINASLHLTDEVADSGIFAAGPRFLLSLYFDQF